MISAVKSRRLRSSLTLKTLRNARHILIYFFLLVDNKYSGTPVFPVPRYTIEASADYLDFAARSFDLGDRSLGERFSLDSYCLGDFAIGEDLDG